MKYIVSMEGKKPFITKYYIERSDKTLRFYYEVYLITNIDQKMNISELDKAFRSNPESDTIFKSLGLEKKMVSSLSQIEANVIANNIESKLLQSALTNNIVNVQFPNASFFYAKEKAEMLQTFLKYFHDNYENIRYQLSEKKDVLDLNITVNDKTSSKIFSKLIELTPNNITAFFILKQLSIYEHNQYLEIELSENKTIEITLNQFSTNYMQFNSDIEIILSSLENLTTTKNLEKTINSLLGGIEYLIDIYKNKENHKIISKNEIYLYINYSLLLIYIYFIVFTSSAKKTSGNIIAVTNHLFKKQGKPINFKYIENDQKFNKPIDLSRINLLSQKYNYLLYIDKKNYVANIFREYYDLETHKKDVDLTSGLTNKLLVNKPKLLKISEHPNNEYETYKTLCTSSTIINLNVSNHLKKLFDLIHNKILPNINLEMIKLNPSTLMIYHEFVMPHINQYICIDEIFYIIYDIILPYAKEHQNISEFVDVFH